MGSRDTLPAAATHRPEALGAGPIQAESYKSFDFRLRLPAVSFPARRLVHLQARSLPALAPNWLSSVLALEVAATGWPTYRMADIRSLVRRISRENPLWGTPRTVAIVAGARVSVVIDIGFGDAVENGAPRSGTTGALLDQPAPRLHAYAREAVIAEKFQAMVMLGGANSRLSPISSDAGAAGKRAAKRS
jgi:hypothetical protein